MLHLFLNVFLYNFVVKKIRIGSIFVINVWMDIHLVLINKNKKLIMMNV